MRGITTFEVSSQGAKWEWIPLIRQGLPNLESDFAWISWV